MRARTLTALPGLIALTLCPLAAGAQTLPTNTSFDTAREMTYGTGGGDQAAGVTTGVTAGTTVYYLFGVTSPGYAWLNYRSGGGSSGFVLDGVTFYDASRAVIDPSARVQGFYYYLPAGAYYVSQYDAQPGLSESLVSVVPQPLTDPETRAPLAAAVLGHVAPAAVPEPSSLVLLAPALLVGAVAVRRRRNAA